MRRSIGWALLTATAAATLALAGCTVHTVQPEPVSAVEVTSAPVDVDVYPHTYYEGRTVYWVNNRWIYSDRGRWVGYRNEPPVLYRHRTVIQQAPPARYERREQRYPAHPQPRYQSAPPATRVQ